jgi:RecJ-like exonuclease
MANFPIGGQATFGMTGCWRCDGTGRKTTQYVPCPRTDMLRKRGKPGGYNSHFQRCPECHGEGNIHVPCDLPCSHCEGTGQVPEDIGDSYFIPRDMPVEIVVANRELTRVESLLGCALGSCVDYGRAYRGLMSESTHSEVVRHLTEEVYTRKEQALHFCTREGRVADGIVVVVSKGGYSAMPKYILPDGKVAYAPRVVHDDALRDLAQDPDRALLLYAGKWEDFWATAQKLGVA